MTVPFRVAPMIRISLPYVWSLASELEAIEKLDTNKEYDVLDLMFVLLGPQYSLEALMRASVFSQTLRSCLPLATELMRILQKHTSRDNYGSEEKVRSGEIWGIKRAYEQFKTAFLAELGTFPAYFVSQKGSHDTLTLLDQSARMFPADLAKKVPDVM